MVGLYDYTPYNPNECTDLGVGNHTAFHDCLHAQVGIGQSVLLLGKPKTL